MDYRLENIINNEVALSKEKKAKLRWRVYTLVRENSRTKKLRDNQMVDEIIKIIMREVENDN